MGKKRQSRKNVTKRTLGVATTLSSISKEWKGKEAKEAKEAKVIDERVTKDLVMENNSSEINVEKNIIDKKPSQFKRIGQTLLDQLVSQKKISDSNSISLKFKKKLRLSNIIIPMDKKTLKLEQDKSKDIKDIQLHDYSLITRHSCCNIGSLYQININDRKISKNIIPKDIFQKRIYNVFDYLSKDESNKKDAISNATSRLMGLNHLLISPELSKIAQRSFIPEFKDDNVLSDYIEQESGNYTTKKSRYIKYLGLCSCQNENITQEEYENVLKGIWPILGLKMVDSVKIKLCLNEADEFFKCGNAFATDEFPKSKCKMLHFINEGMDNESKLSIFEEPYNPDICFRKSGMWK